MCTACGSPKRGVSRTSSPTPSPIATARCIPPCSAWMTSWWRYRFAPSPCTKWPNMVSPCTGTTKMSGIVPRPRPKNCSPGCANWPIGSAICVQPTPATPSSWKQSKTISLKSRSSCLPPRVRSKICLLVRLRLTLPIASIQRWGTGAQERV